MYPYPFISLMNPDGAESVVAVSDAADEAELTAAMMLMAGMGNSLSAKNAMTLCRLSDAKSENVLYVGLKKNTPEHLLSLLTQSVPATGALVQRATDGDTSYLLIVAEEEAALSEAAALLSDTSLWRSSTHRRPTFPSAKRSSMPSRRNVRADACGAVHH